MIKIKETDPQISNSQIQRPTFRMIFGLSGLGIGKRVDNYVEARLPRRRGFTRRTFFHRSFYGLSGYTFGNIIDNIVDPLK